MAVDIQWYDPHGHVSDRELGGVEDYFGVRFPKDYLAVAKDYNGASPIADTFSFEYKEAVFDRLLSLHVDNGEYLVRVYEQIKDRFVPEVIPFADDVFGNFLCFDYRGGPSPTITYWDHERAHLDPASALFPVCDTFTDLLNRLHE